MSASSTVEVPWTTTASTGTLSPGTTFSLSPLCTSSTGIISSLQPKNNVIIRLTQPFAATQLGLWGGGGGCGGRWRGIGVCIHCICAIISGQPAIYIVSTTHVHVHNMMCKHLYMYYRPIACDVIGCAQRFTLEDNWSYCLWGRMYRGCLCHSFAKNAGICFSCGCGIHLRTDL